MFKSSKYFSVQMWQDHRVTCSPTIKFYTKYVIYFWQDFKTNEFLKKKCWRLCLHYIGVCMLWRWIKRTLFGQTTAWRRLALQWNQILGWGVGGITEWLYNTAIGSQPVCSKTVNSSHYIILSCHAFKPIGDVFDSCMYFFELVLVYLEFF